MEKIKIIADAIKEKMPSLLASKSGLDVACGLFTIMDARDRKTVVKSLPVEEMLTNKVAHLFLIHVTTTLDDTQLTKKKILHEALKVVDDQINDKCYQAVLLAALTQRDIFFKKNITKEDAACLQTFSKFSTSKKDHSIRHAELVKIVQKPLERFFEEKLSFYLADIEHSVVMRSLCVAIMQNGSMGESDFIDEMFR